MSKAKDRPVFTSTETDVRDLETPQSQSVEMSPAASAEDLRAQLLSTQLTAEDLRDELIGGGKAVETVDFHGKQVTKGYLEEMLFNEQELEILIHPTDDPNAENLIKLGVQGVNQFVVRGQPTKVKRKYVEVLARAKPVNVKTREGLDPNGGRTVFIDKSVGIKYPFSILRDPAGARGEQWLRAVMASE